MTIKAMEVRRRSYRNQLRNELQQAIVVRDRAVATIRRIKNSEMGVEYVRTQITKWTGIKEEKIGLIDWLNQQIPMVMLGGSDDLINKMYEQDHAQVAASCAMADRKRAERRAEKQAQKKAGQDRWRQIKEMRRAERSKQRDLRYGLRQFDKANSTLPDYIKKHLKRMPNNHGYIWRSVYYYGDKPDDGSGKTIMTENRKGVTIIRETDQHETRVYEKPSGKSRERGRRPKKKLVQTIPRRQLNQGVNLLDFVTVVE